ncbi:MAG: threonine--tRNA ligase [Rickettsiales bacterium]|jgi:threonyl-tRNA synthetase|nr:threonine--tRNA ligase [Rickettsiales bacterium]
MSYDIEIIRHSLAHILAAAVQKLFPGVKFAGGPAIENGFYYDFDTDHRFVPEDFAKIEKEMRDLIKSDGRFEQKTISKSEARELFADQPYKLEWINEIPDANVSIYKFRDFVDLCRGPHAASSKELPKDAFKIRTLAGAYWKGDSKNKMLQRIYVDAFATKDELDAHLKFMEEAALRDHRKIGAALDLFHFDPEYAPGNVFWHPKGWTIFQELVKYMRDRQEGEEYQEINTPSLCSRKMFETSGHWKMYAAHIYYAKVRDEDGEFAAKPVSCPGGMLVFKQGIKSHHDLPMKISEFGKVDRYESSGALAGLMRVREFTQDDAHIFCTEEQVETECVKVIKLIMDIYKDFGFNNVRIKLSTRPAERLGSDEIWDISEAALANALKAGGYDFELFPGEGAIYGPKLEFVLKDAIGRDWQCGTLQFDMNLPERFDINYVDKDGEKKRPIMLHRALFGSLERFIGILIEQFAGKLPLWISPVHAVIIPISEAHQKYADEIADKLSRSAVFTSSRGFRIEKSYSSDSMQKRIRDAQLMQIPYMFVLGDKEMADGTISIRTRDNKQMNGIQLDEFILTMRSKIYAREFDL